MTRERALACCSMPLRDFASRIFSLFGHDLCLLRKEAGTRGTLYRTTNAFLILRGPGVAPESLARRMRLCAGPASVSRRCRTLWNATPGLPQSALPKPLTGIQARTGRSLPRQRPAGSHFNFKFTADRPALATPAPRAVVRSGTAAAPCVQGARGSSRLPRAPRCWR